MNVSPASNSQIGTLYPDVANAQPPADRPAALPPSIAPSPIARTSDALYSQKLFSLSQQINSSRDPNPTARIETASGPQKIDSRGYQGFQDAGPSVMPTVANFNADAYLSRNPDVAATTPRDFALNHYLAFGRAEGRAA